jgi:hypothetical protein
MIRPQHLKLTPFVVRQPTHTHTHTASKEERVRPRRRPLEGKEED